MDLFRAAARVLFAVAIAAQLSAPVLAANAKALNLFCPSHASKTHEFDAHSAHAAQDTPAAHEVHHASAPVTSDESQQARKPFDLSCCSVHLTGVVPSLSSSFAAIPAVLQDISVNDQDAAFRGAVDPPPRIFV